MFHWWNNLPLRWKLALPLVLMAVLNAGAMALEQSLNNRLTQSTQTIGKVYLTASNLVLQADRDLHQALIAERAMLHTDPTSKDFEKLNQDRLENIQQAHDRTAKFAALITAPWAQNDLSGWAEHLPAWKKHSDQIVNGLKSNTDDARAQARTLSIGKGDELFQQARDHLDHLGEGVGNHANDAVDSVNGAIKRDGSILMGTLFVVIALSVLIAIFFPMMITRPLALISARMDDLNSGNGDLTLRLNINRSDELGQMAKRFDVFLDTVHGIVSRITENVNHLASSADQLTATSAQSQSTAEGQHNAADQVSVASTEMAATVQEITVNVSHAAESAAAANNESNTVKEAMQGTLTRIQALANEVDRTATQATELEREADNIGGVLDVIQSIAEQTNLLALNAAIEAARAGEHGRGFAVVADEVRELANRTRRATEETREMIEHLQSGSRDTVQALSQGRERASETVTEADGASTRLTSILERIGTISDMTHQIAAATEEQSQTIEEINRNIVDISDRAGHGVQVAQEVRSASDNLSRMAADLTQLVSRFRV